MDQARVFTDGAQALGVYFFRQESGTLILNIIYELNDDELTMRGKKKFSAYLSWL